jgi:hypothetical protein
LKSQHSSELDSAGSNPCPAQTGRARCAGRLPFSTTDKFELPHLLDGVTRAGPAGRWFVAQNGSLVLSF